MRPFTAHTGICAPVRLANVDTDQIIPSREMYRVSKHGLGEGLFAGWRYLYEGKEKTGTNPKFVLNQPQFRDTSILLGGVNFGCGSSREHAVWALVDYGIRVIIAESFGRIFHANCARNGLLAIRLDPRAINQLANFIGQDPQKNRVCVNLETLKITAGETAIAFETESFDREMLLKGLDYIDYTLQYSNDIDRHTQTDQQQRPWAYIES